MVIARDSITLVQTVDISGYYRFYKLQASTAAKPAKPTSITTLPPSGWSDTEPSYTEGSTNSLYFVDLTTFSDNTFEYSDVSLSSSYEAAKQAYNKAHIAQESIDNLEIGGRNLIHNTNVIDLSSTATLPNIAGDSEKGYILGVHSAANGYLESATHGVRAVTTAATRPGLMLGLNNVNIGLHGLETGRTYTWSFDWTIKTFSGSPPTTTSYHLRAYLGYVPAGESEFNTNTYKEVHTFYASDRSDRGSEISGRCEFTFDLPEGATAMRLWITTNSTTASYYAAGDFLELRNIKLEVGNKATAWTPAPEDMDAQIDNIQVGGKNLLTGTNSTTELTATGYWADHTWRTAGSGSGTTTSVSVTDCPDKSITTGWQFDVTSVPNEPYSGARSIGQNRTPIIAGQEYTLSCYAKGTGKLYMFYGISSFAPVDLSGKIDLTSEWKRYSVTFTAESATAYVADTGANVFFGIFGTDVTGYICGMKLETGNKLTDWSPAPEDAVDTTIEYIVGTQTAATGNWIGKTRETSLRVGKMIMYQLPYAGSGNASLQLTLADGTLTDNIPVYMTYSTGSNTGAKTRVTTHWPAGSVIELVYNGTEWYSSNYNTNINNVDRVLYGVSLAASVAISAGRIAVMGSDGKLKLLNATTFDINCPPLYVGTAYSAANVTDAKKRATNYMAWGTAFSFTNTHSIAGAAAGKTVYIVGNLDGNLFTPTSTVLTCNVPAANDDLYYIRLGRLSTVANGVLEMEHPIFAYIDGSFQPIDAAAQTSAENANNANEALNEDIYGEPFYQYTTGGVTYDVWKAENGKYYYDDGSGTDHEVAASSLDQDSDGYIIVRHGGLQDSVEKIAGSVLVDEIEPSVTIQAKHTENASTRTAAVKITDERVSFNKNGEEVAYIDSNEDEGVLDINNERIHVSLRIGQLELFDHNGGIGIRRYD